MDIVDPACAVLSNFEVLQLVTESFEQLKGGAAKGDAEPSVENLNTITYELKRYLSHTPAVVQSEPVVIEFLKTLKKYPLSRFERLQLLNFRPGSEVLFLRLVEEGEERFSADVIAEILELIERLLPPPPVADGESEAVEASLAEEPEHTGDGDAEGEGDNAMEEDEDYPDADHPTDEFVNEKDAVDSEGEADD
eukprot:m.121327 g.121327  ORF g.121327 m.121327 type:complete len:194 (+) comp13381_c0_seq1:4043-4624(+)